jgi:hypothetical protein
VRLGRSATVAGAAGAITLALLLAAGSRAATRDVRAATPNIVGTWQIDTHLRGGVYGRVTTHGTIRITSFDRHTGKFAGSGTESVSDVFFRISGSVDGRSIRMTVSGGGDTARDRGAIRADGSFTGTLSDNYGSKGRWTMTRQSVVATKIGWGRDSYFYSEGARVVNRSKRDALGVTVTINDSQRGGYGLGAYQLSVSDLPAGKSFVVAEGPFGGGSYVTKLGATVQVHRMVRHVGADRLLGVSNVGIDRKNEVVNAVITNTLPHSINLQNVTTGAYAVVYNASGRIIGGDRPRSKSRLRCRRSLGPRSPRPLSRRRSRAEASA